jgi:hypothetical protein
MKKFIQFLCTGVAAFLVAETPLMAQQRGGGGGFDPEQMRARMMERLQENLGVTSQEWEAIRPLVENVVEKQREANMGRGGFAAFGGGRGPGGPGGPGAGPRAGRGPGAAASEAQALQQAVQSGNNTEIQAKLKEFRAAREAREKALQESREKLRSVLSVKQEAALVVAGILD